MEGFSLKSLTNSGIQYNEQDIRSMLNNTPYLMWIKDDQYRFRFVNNEFLEFFNLEKKDVIGIKDTEVLFKVKGNVNTEYEEPLKQKMYESKKYKIIINNVTKWVESYMWPLYKTGEKKGWVAGIATDITTDKIIDKAIYDTGYDSYDSEYVLTSVLNSLMEQAKGIGAGIFIYDSRNKTLKLSVSCGCCSNIPKNYSFKISDEEYKQAIDNELFKRFDSESDDIWRKNLKSFLHDSLLMKIYNLNDNEDGNVIGFCTIFYRKSIDRIICKNEFVKGRCRKIAYLYMKKGIIKNLKNELRKRKVNEKYMKILLDTATDFYGVIDVDKKRKSFKVRDMYNIGIGDKEIIRVIERLEYNGDKGKMVSDINGYDIKSKVCCIKENEKEDRFIEFRWHPIDEKQVIITGKDKTIEKQLADYNKELEKYIEVENMKSEFFANLSHEFKTPINIIITASQLIKTNGIITNEKAFEKYMSVMKQNSYRLSRLINNLIDTRRIDNGYYKLDLINYNIVKVIEEAVVSMKDYIYSKERDFIYESDCDEIILACDPEKIERIIFNLISNAVKYTNKYDEIRIKIEQKDKHVFITVSNNGVKLNHESAEVIFNRFVRADNVLSRRCEGSGIGLYIVKSLVELHNGKVWVDINEEDKTKFIISIPIIKAGDTDCKKIDGTSPNNKERCNMEFSDIY